MSPLVWFLFIAIGIALFVLGMAVLHLRSALDYERDRARDTRESGRKEYWELVYRVIDIECALKEIGFEREAAQSARWVKKK